MDNKNSYETYEFLPGNNIESDANQLFVLPDDGTFLVNREIQYVTEDVREVQEEVQSCTVYDVSSQQFFVDVDNSAELVSVSDQFVIPSGNNNLCTNSYLIQPGSSTRSEQMEENVGNQYKAPDIQDADIDLVSGASKQVNNFTEITLSNDQYQILERKGWILLESNDRIFVLNTLGLHDITSNEKLIQKLKNEIQSDTDMQIDIGSVKTEGVSCSNSNQQDMVEFIIKHDDVAQNEDQMDPITFYVSGKEEIQQPVLHSEKQPNVKSEVGNVLKNETFQINTMLQKQENNCVKIKTKHTFKEIPSRILLGKSANGKKIYAKVIKSTTNINNKFEDGKNESIIIHENIGENQEFATEGLKESEFLNLLRDAIMSNPQRNVSAEDIAAAETVIAQLLTLENLKKSVVERYLIFTRVKTTIVNNQNDTGKVYSSGRPTLITGRVDLSETTHGLFHHFPNMVQEIIAGLENEGEKSRKHDINILHIHVSESRCPDNTLTASVILNKRKLALNLIFEAKQNLKTVYACSTCAAVFKSEPALKEHQENHFMDADDSLMIDTEQINKTKNNAYLKIKSGKETHYSCTQCETKFTRLGSCIKHLKTHSNSMNAQVENDNEISDQQSDTEKKTNVEIYKCKMCPSTYFHSSSLSKHIVKSHIQRKLN